MRLAKRYPILMAAMAFALMTTLVLGSPPTKAQAPADRAAVEQVAPEAASPSTAPVEAAQEARIAPDVAGAPVGRQEVTGVITGDRQYAGGGGRRWRPRNAARPRIPPATGNEGWSLREERGEASGPRPFSPSVRTPDGVLRRWGR